MLSMLREIQQLIGVRFHFCVPGYRMIAIPDGETVLRVKDPTLAKLFVDQYGEALAVEPNLDSAPLPRVRVDSTAAASNPSGRRVDGRPLRKIPGEHEQLPNGYAIAFEGHEDGNKLRTRWVIYSPEGRQTGERLTRDEAVQAAAELAELRQ